MKKVLSILSALSLTTLASTTVIACNNQSESQTETTLILNKVLADLEKERGFNPNNWTISTSDEKIKTDFLNYLQKNNKDFDINEITKLEIIRDIANHYILIKIFHEDKKQEIKQIYNITTNISLLEEENK